MKALRRLYYKIFKTYRRLELRMFSWDEADKILRQQRDKPFIEQWHLAKEEDGNFAIGFGMDGTQTTNITINLKHLFYE